MTQKTAGTDLDAPSSLTAGEELRSTCRARSSSRGPPSCQIRNTEKQIRGVASEQGTRSEEEDLCAAKEIDRSYLTILSRSRRCCPSPAAAAAGAGSRRPWAAAPRRPVAARRRPAEGTPAGPAEGNPCPAAGKLQIRAKNETQTDQYRATNSSSEFRVR